MDQIERRLGGQDLTSERIVGCSRTVAQCGVRVKPACCHRKCQHDNCTPKIVKTLNCFLQIKITSTFFFINFIQKQVFKKLNIPAKCYTSQSVRTVEKGAKETRQMATCNSASKLLDDTTKNAVSKNVCRPLHVS